jgi:MFS family permease
LKWEAVLPIFTVVLRRGLSVLGRAAVDIAPLRECPPYRRLWAGNGLSSVGGQMTQYAVLLQVYLLTHHSFDVGLVGLAIAIPTVVVSVSAGPLIDRVDRRRTVLVCTTIQAGLSSLLAYQAFARLDHLWLLYVVVVAQASVGAVNAPARRTFMPNLLPRDQLAAGAALQTLTMHGALTAGPALAGLITAAAGLPVCYVVDAVSFAFALYGVARLPRTLPRSGKAATGHLRAAVDGFAFIGRERPVLGATVADMMAAFLAMPIALFPAINAHRFGGHPETLGLMTTAIAVGGVVGSGLSGTASRINRRGLAVLAAGAVWGAGIAVFGLADRTWLALLALAVAGAGDSTAVNLRTAIVQELTPDELRGRVTAAEFAAGAGVPQLGNTRAGLVASLTSPGVSAVAGGLSAVAGAVAIGALVPALVRFRRPAAPVPSPRDGPPV